MIKLFLIIVIFGLLYQGIGMTAEIYRWTDKNGTIVFSDSPPPYGTFKKEKVEDQIDKTIEQRKQIDRRMDLNESDKIEEKLKIEMDYQKKAKSIRDYNSMREELRTLEEKYQKKYDELRERSSGRLDILEDSRRLRREYQKEIRRIKDYYGYH